MGSDGWIETTIGEQATLQRGIDITKAQQRPGAVPVVSSGGVSSFHDTAQVSGPGVILGRKGVVGSVYFIEADYWPHDTTLWVKNFHGNDPRFVYYFFKSITAQIEGMDVGSANPTLNRNHVHPIKIRWPAIEIQRAIAHILGSLDDKIELNRQMNRTLEQMAQAIFKSWFIDFDPVHAKAAGRDTGLPKEIADLFPDSFEESELGEIPTGWKVKALKDVIRGVNDRVGEAVVPEYSSTNDGLQLRSERFSKKLSASNKNNKIIRQGSLVFGLSRRVLNFGLMREEIGCVSPAYKVFDVNQEVIVPDFLERIMRMKRAYFYNAVSSSSREGQSISPDGLGILCFVKPVKAIPEAYYKLTGPFERGMITLKAESLKLASLRDSLLSKLLSGELDVSALQEMEVA